MAVIEKDGGHSYFLHPIIDKHSLHSYSHLGRPPLHGPVMIFISKEAR
jgi:hypothetical protein